MEVGRRLRGRAGGSEDTMKSRENVSMGRFDVGWVGGVRIAV